MTSIESAGFHRPVDLRGHTGGGGLEAARVGMPGVDSMHYDQSMGWLVVRGSHGLVTVPKSNIKWMRPSDQSGETTVTPRGQEAVSAPISLPMEREPESARDYAERVDREHEVVTAVTRKKRGKRKR